MAWSPSTARARPSRWRKSRSGRNHASPSPGCTSTMSRLWRSRNPAGGETGVDRRMNLTFTPSAWNDYQWFQQHDRKLLKRINLLIEDILWTPFEGIGKPEPLRNGFKKGSDPLKSRGQTPF